MRFERLNRPPALLPFTTELRRTSATAIIQAQKNPGVAIEGTTWREGHGFTNLRTYTDDMMESWRYGT